MTKDKPTEDKPILSQDAIQLLKQQAAHPLSDYNLTFKIRENIDSLLEEANLNQDNPWNQNHPIAKLNKFITYEICTLQTIQQSLTQHLTNNQKDRKDLKTQKERVTKHRLSEVEKFQKQIEGMSLEQIMANKKLAKKLEKLNLDGL